MNKNILGEKTIGINLQEKYSEWKYTGAEEGNVKWVNLNEKMLNESESNKFKEDKYSREEVKDKWQEK